MKDVIFLIGIPVAAYLIGSIPFGFLIGKWHGIDIRTVGSGNIGATNVTRSVGKRAGKLCFLLDFLKGMLPVLLVQHFAPVPPELALAAALGVILGHIFPVYLDFKGGKGISTAAGVGLALAPLPLLAALAAWIVAFLTTRYVSLASIAAAVVLPAAVWIFPCAGLGGAVPLATRIFFTVIGAAAILRHRENIRRLLNGTESRFERKRKAQ